MRFVAADDSSIELDVVVGALKRAGHQCVGKAKDGSEVIDLCARERPDVAILDISMNMVSGKDAARIIRDASTATTIILVSSLCAIPAVAADLRAEGFKTITKPYKRETLADQVEKLIAHGSSG